MIHIQQYKDEINAAKQNIEEIGDALEIDHLQLRLRELNAEMSDPNFWDRLKHAQAVNKEIRTIENKLNTYNKLSDKADDVEMMLELLEEEDDAEMESEFMSSVKNLTETADTFRLTTLLTGKYDANNAILSLNSGAGGTEAQDWTEMLYRMYKRWVDRRDFKLKTLEYLAGDVAGVKSVTFLVEGENAYGYLKAEKGVHRLVRISPFDSNARRHTSFASLDVMPELGESDDVKPPPSDDLRIDTFRSSGAGGQHVNTTDSAIRITHLPTGIVVSCQNERSQIQNRETAMRMLMSKLADLQEQERLAQLNDIQGELKRIEWGSQIRSYVFQPYTMVKDHRTMAETGNVVSVMDGDIDMFINEYLKKANA